MDQSISVSISEVSNALGEQQQYVLILFPQNVQTCSPAKAPFSSVSKSMHNCPTSASFPGKITL
jgi:hypothetical protein